MAPTVGRLALPPCFSLVILISAPEFGISCLSFHAGLFGLRFFDFALGF